MALTPLAIASEKDDDAIVEILLEQGASPLKLTEELRDQTQTPSISSLTGPGSSSTFASSSSSSSNSTFSSQTSSQSTATNSLVSRFQLIFIGKNLLELFDLLKLFLIISFKKGLKCEFQKY